MTNAEAVIAQGISGLESLVRWAVTCRECPMYDSCDSTDPTSCVDNLCGWLRREYESSGNSEQR